MSSLWRRPIFEEKKIKTFFKQATIFNEMTINHLNVSFQLEFDCLIELLGHYMIALEEKFSHQPFIRLDRMKLIEI